MEYILNIGLAKVSLVLSVLLSVIYLIRKVNLNLFKGENLLLKNINLLLRKCHKPLGILLIFTGLVHGLYSSYPLLSLNLGTLCWVLSVLLGLNYCFKSAFKYKGWIYYHRVLTILFLLTLILHIVFVKYNSFPLKSYNSNNSIVVNQLDNTENQSSNKATNNNNSSNSSNSNDTNNTNTDTSNNSIINATTESSASKLNDGTYVGEANGYRPSLKVQVTIKNNKIENIVILDNNETPKYLERTSDTIIQRILNSQSTKVQSVSGATMISNGIMKATENAITNSKK